MDTSRLWVGKKAEEILVFDPDAQVQGSDLVLVWNTATGQLETYVATLLRKHVHRTESPELVSSAVASYCAWRQSSRAALAEQQADLRRRAEKERIQRLTLEERHAAFLAERGLEYARLRTADGKKNPRITHCYACTRSLDNSIDAECTACRWIICSCGACGCGYGL